MKWTIVAGIIMAGMSFSQWAKAASSEVTYRGGGIQFTGSLTDGPCAVDVSNGERIVSLSQVKKSNLMVPGEPAGQVRIFHVILHDCNISVYSNATVSFSGQTDSTFSSVLINQATTEAAEKVGLQLYGPDGDKIIPDDSSSVKLTDGLNVLPLTVDYVPTELNATAGNVTSTVTFNIIYS